MSTDDLIGEVGREARELYEAFRERKLSDDAAELEAYCLERPDLADELRALDRAFREADALLARCGAAAREGSLGDSGARPTPDGEEAAPAGGDHAPGRHAGPDASSLLFIRLIEDLKSPRDPAGYRALGMVARGGMSEIHEVFDERLRRSLAMKVFPVDCRKALSRGDRRRVSRFLEEAQVAAQLRHPSILPVHDVGINGRGNPFFTMPLVQGRNFAAIIDAIHRADGVRENDSGWSLLRGLGVVQKVCEAVAYAHSKGVVHRDLKPDNVMVGRFGQIYVMDWGLAKVMEPERDGSLASREDFEKTVELETLRRVFAGDTPVSPMMTIDGQVVGTPAYMAPEQASGQAGAAGPRSDIYSAGALLYQLLTGERPYAHLGKTTTPGEVVRAVRTGSPRLVSSVNPRIPAELAAVCGKAMAREPAARYGTMLEMARDIEAYLEQRVVKAYETGALAELRKWIRRNRGLAAAVMGAMLAVIGGFAGILWVQTANQAELKRSNLKLEAAEAAAARRIYFNNITFAQQAYERNSTPRMKAILSQCDPKWRGWEWHFLHHLADASVQTYEGHEGQVADIAVAPGGGWFISAGYDRTVRFWDTASGRERVRAIEQSDVIDSVDVSPDGRRIVCGVADSTARVWSLERGEILKVLEPIDGRPRAWFLPDGDRILTLDEKEAKVWEAASGRLIERLDPGQAPAARIAFSPEGDRFASRNRAEMVCLWDTRTLKIERELGKLGGEVSMAFSPDGVRLAACGIESPTNVVLLYDLDRKEIAARFPCEGTCRRLTASFHPRGDRLAVASDNDIHLFDLDRGVRIARLKGHTDEIRVTRFLPDGGLLSGARDHTIKRWDLSRDPAPFSLRENRSSITAIGFTADSRRIAASSYSGEVCIYDLESRILLKRIKSRESRTYAMAISPDGALIATAGNDVSFWDGLTGENLYIHKQFLGVLTTVLFDSTGDRYFVGGRDGFLFRKTDRSDEKRVPFRTQDADFHPDGRRIVTAGRDGSIVIWNTDTMEEVRRIPDAYDGQPVKAARYSPDGRMIATIGVSNDTVVLLWDAETGRRLTEIRGEQQPPHDLAFTPDGERLITVADREQPLVWDTRTGELVLAIPCEPGQFRKIRFSPDGRYLTAVDSEGGLLVWEIPESDRPNLISR